MRIFHCPVCQKSFIESDIETYFCDHWSKSGSLISTFKLAFYHSKQAYFYLMIPDFGILTLKPKIDHRPPMTEINFYNKNHSHQQVDAPNDHWDFQNLDNLKQQIKNILAFS